MKRTLFLLGFLACLAGCPSSTGVGPRPQPIAAGGTYVHEPSRFEFPETFGRFRRVGINQYDDHGNDVGAAYNLHEDVAVALTLYVYPIRREPSGRLIPLDQQFEFERADIIRQHPGAHSNPPWIPQRTQNGEPLPGHAVSFRYEDRFADGIYVLTSLLYLFEYDGWLVKYRITFAAAQAAKANPAAEDFVSRFVWRGAS